MFCACAPVSEAAILSRSLRAVTGPAEALQVAEVVVAGIGVDVIDMACCPRPALSVADNTER